MYKTAMRLSLRRARRSARESLGVVDRPGPDDLTGADARVDVLRALRSLPIRQRQVVVLRDWAGYETAAVGRMLGLRDSTVRVHLARGRASLRSALSIREEHRGR